MSDLNMSNNSTQPAKILIVDDKKKVRESLSLALKGRNFAPLSAADAEEAWEKVSEEEPDLALIDIMLGEDNGLDLLKKIRMMDNPLPVLVFTGYGTIETAMEAITLGAFNYLQKPVKMDQLEPMIRSALRLRFLELENRDLQSIVSRREENIVDGEHRFKRSHGHPNSRDDRSSGNLHQEMEEDLIRRVLSECGGNKKRSAEVLGISRATLYNKIKEYGLT
jgi:DNA-binding NtrC family response regulator